MQKKVENKDNLVNAIVLWLIMKGEVSSRKADN